MEREDEELLDLARRWMPYKEVPADEVFVRYGISRGVYYRRLQHIAAGPAGRRLSFAERRFVESLQEHPEARAVDRGLQDSRLG